MHLKATLLLKQNIDALLVKRGYKRKDLAQWCRRTEGWISKIFNQPEREIPSKYFDRIADFFGLATYQLFQPGIASASERRKSRDRRSGTDRRVAKRMEQMSAEFRHQRIPKTGITPRVEAEAQPHDRTVSPVVIAQLHQLVHDLTDTLTALEIAQSAGTAPTREPARRKVVD